MGAGPLSAQYSIVDSFYYYIDKQEVYDQSVLNDKFVELTNSVFNNYTVVQIDTISTLLSAKIQDLNDLKSRVILHQIRCAYLNNASLFEEAEECENQVLEWAKESNRDDIQILALEDLNFIYNHQGGYDDQVSVIKNAIDISFVLELDIDRVYYYAWLG